jgi:Chromate transporter
MAPFRIAILWRGDREARRTASAQNNRYHRIFEELSGLGIHAEPAVYDEEFADEVCEQLLKVDGVLVWVDPLSRGKTRALLDPMLRDVTPKEFVDGLALGQLAPGPPLMLAAFIGFKLFGIAGAAEAGAAIFVGYWHITDLLRCPPDVCYRG